MHWFDSWIVIRAMCECVIFPADTVEFFQYFPSILSNKHTHTHTHPHTHTHIHTHTHTHLPPTDTMTFPDNSQPPSSLEGWKLISSRSTSHNPFPPLHDASSAISPHPQAIISSYLGATRKRCLPLALILFPFPMQHQHSHRIIAGSQGHYQESKESWGKDISL